MKDNDEQVARLPLGVPVVTKEGYTVRVVLWPEQLRAKICSEATMGSHHLKSLSGDELLEYVSAAVRVGKLFEEKGFTVTY